MEEILHHLRCIKPYEYLDIYYMLHPVAGFLPSTGSCKILFYRNCPQIKNATCRTKKIEGAVEGGILVFNFSFNSILLGVSFTRQSDGMGSFHQPEWILEVHGKV